MSKAKLRVEGNSYFTVSKNAFIGKPFNKNIVDSVFDFAFNMTFGNEGEHRGYRSGGQYSRKNGELFANTFQGKLAEFAIYQELSSNEIEATSPDLEKWKLGKWDECDFNVNSMKISVKSAAFFSDLLLLETKDWNQSGYYIPNDTGYDFHILCRIKPDLKGVMRGNRLLFSSTVEQQKLKKIIDSLIFEYDIPGYLKIEELKAIILNNQILPQNALLNGTTQMDAENYYCQAGELNPLQSLIDLLK